MLTFFFFFFQAEDGIRDLVRSRGLGDVYKRQVEILATQHASNEKITYKARWLVGADGPSSPVLRAIYGNTYKLAPMFFVGQKFHTIKECPLDPQYFHCLLYTSDAADERSSVDLGGRRIIKKKQK